MLFSGLANAGFGGLGGSGFGMMEILLFAGLGYFIYRKFRSPAVAGGYGGMPYQNTEIILPIHSGSAPAINNDIDYRSPMMD